MTVAMVSSLQAVWPESKSAHEAMQVEERIAWHDPDAMDDVRFLSLSNSSMLGVGEQAHWTARCGCAGQAVHSEPFGLQHPGRGLGRCCHEHCADCSASEYPGLYCHAAE